LIEGETVDKLRLPLRQAIEALRSIALALHHVHGQGVVHRDVKPSNIMIDRRGTAWIVDFGIALLSGTEDRLTATGAVLGTAAYMSPEQARGETPVQETAIDVYGLGATLYDLATGHPPFVGESFAEIINKVNRDEPVAPRKLNSRLSRDVETVILKAMEKDPSRRYASAAEYAEDLGRLLADEPVRARPASAAYRLWKWVRKNRPAAVLATAAAAAVVVAATFALQAVERSHRLDQVTREQQLERGQAVKLLRETARVSLDAALELRREGANDRMRKFLEPLEAAYRQAVQRAPDLAEVDYRMGRMYRAMLEDATALEYQRRALAKDPDYSAAIYERAVLLAKKYAGNLKKAGQDAAAQERSAGEFARALQTITSDCTRLEQLLAKGGEVLVTEANLLAARGILAFYQQRFVEASQLLNQAVERDPYMEEAWEALAKTTLQLPGAAGDLRRREAIALFDRGLARDRGYVPLLLGRGQTLMSFAYERIERGDDPSVEMAAAQKDFEAAVRLRPGDAEAWLQIADLLSNRAFLAAARGQDPVDLYEGAERRFTRAIELDAGLTAAWRGRGILRTYRARYLQEHGEDAESEWTGALGDMGRFVSLTEHAEHWRLADALMRRATVLAERALARKPSAESDLAMAEADFEKAIKLDGSQARIWSRRGAARLKHAETLIRDGKDPMGEFERAEADLTKAIREQATFFEAWSKRGILRSRRAQYLTKQGKESSSDVAGAATDLTRAIELNKGTIEAWTERGYLRLWQAEQEGRPAQARADYDKAAADFSQAIVINPGLAATFDKRLGALRERLKSSEGKD